MVGMLVVASLHTTVVFSAKHGKNFASLRTTVGFQSRGGLRENVNADRCGINRTIGGLIQKSLLPLAGWCLRDGFGSQLDIMKALGR